MIFYVDSDVYVVSLLFVIGWQLNLCIFEIKNYSVKLLTYGD